MNDAGDDHCRIGSLESTLTGAVYYDSDHCRIGSLEKALINGMEERFRSLPHRQLRNIFGINNTDDL